MPEKLRKIRLVSHSPTDRPSRRAAARAASRASGGIPATFQGSSARISNQRHRTPATEGTGGHIWCKGMVDVTSGCATHPVLGHAQIVESLCLTDGESGDQFPP